MHATPSEARSSHRFITVLQTFPLMFPKAISNLQSVLLHQHHHGHCFLFHEQQGLSFLFLYLFVGDQCRQGVYCAGQFLEESCIGLLERLCRARLPSQRFSDLPPEPEHLRRRGGERLAFSDLDKAFPDRSADRLVVGLRDDFLEPPRPLFDLSLMGVELFVNSP